MESLLCPVLIERIDQLGTLTAALDEAARGRGQTIFVTGDAGVGKSRLVREVSQLASARGFHVLTGRGTESTVPVPYRPVTEALMGAARGGVTPGSPGIADYRAALGSLVPEWRQPHDRTGHISAMILGDAVLRLLTQPNWHGGLLVLEDLHWADPETLAFVEYLADNIGGTSVLCLITQRDVAGSPAADLLQSATSRRAAGVVEVPRLTQVAVAQMAAACLSVEHLPPDIARLLADCDGLPFAVEELLAASVSSGELIHGGSGWQVNPDVSTGVPDSIAGSVRNRLNALGAAMAGVLVSAAILGRQFDWALLPKVGDATESDVLDALKRARQVGLIEPVGSDGRSFRFRHSLTRDAIVSDLLPPNLASQSAAAAAAIEEAHPGLPGTWCELAAELRVAAGQPHAAARLLLTAGTRDLAQGSLSSTIATLSDARQLLARAPADNPELPIEIDERLADALALTGDYERLVPVTEELIARLNTAAGSPRRQALAHLRVAITRPADKPDVVAAHLHAADSIAGRLNDSELATRVDATAARIALATGELDRAEELASRSLRWTERSDGADSAAEIALISLEVLGRRERLRDADAAAATFKHAVALAEQHERGAWGIRAQHELATIEMLRDGSTGSLSEVRELAHRAGVITTAAIIELQLANLWSLGSDLDKALAVARQCRRTALQIRMQRLAALAMCVEASIAAIRGSRKETERIAQRAEALLPGDPDILAAAHGQARVLAALFRDDIPRALRDSSAAMSFAPDAGTAAIRLRGYYSALQSPVVAPSRAIALHALLQATCGGNARHAIQRARDTGADKSWNQGCLAYAQAVLEGQAGRRDRASELAREAGAHFGPFAPWWNHLARRLVAEHALHDGWGEPVAWMREAAPEFDAMRHARLASACRGVLRRAGERVPRAGRGSAQVPADMRRLGITSREMDVFALVARGMSNSQIATELYISAKTVETHVASLIAKTGKSGRRELVAHAAGVSRS